MADRRGDALAHLARLGGDAAVALDVGAAAFARLHGEDGPLDGLDTLAGLVDAGAGCGALAAALAGFRLDEDDGAQLPLVLAAGAGAPSTLALVWLEVARRLGWRAEMPAFAALALVRLVDGQGGCVIIDAACGRAMDAADLRAALKALSGAAAELRPAHFSPLSNRDILIRQQGEIKTRALLGGRIAHAVAVVEGLLAFAPEQVSLWREAGMMHLRLDRKAHAIAALEQFAARTGNAAARRRTQQLLHDLRAHLP